LRKGGIRAGSSVESGEGSEPVNGTRKRGKGRPTVFWKKRTKGKGGGGENVGHHVEETDHNKKNRREGKGGEKRE